jgi:rod shape determining protein RodA
LRRPENTSIFNNIDWITVLTWMAMVALGLGNIYSAVFKEEHPYLLDFSQKYGTQIIWIGGAMIIALAILIIDAEFYPTFTWVIYGISIFMLIAVIFLGREVAGSKSWFRIGSVGIQPAEFAKFSICLALAKYLSDVNIKMADMKTRATAMGIILLPTLSIIAEKETGCALVLLSLILVLYREGLPGYLLGLCFAMLLLFFFALKFPHALLIAYCGGTAFLVFLFARKKLRNFVFITAAFLLSVGIILGSHGVFKHLPKHQVKRINVYLNIKSDTESEEDRTDSELDAAQEEKAKRDKNKAWDKDKAWNENQSIIAIGSGGFAGKGYLQGTQTKYDFVPEQETDFIFCTVGEEWGFLGSTGIVFLFAFLIVRIILLAERQRSSFSRIYGYGVASIFLFHVLVNIGMTIRLIPVIGIPLPFFSYGGSSLWAFTILLFIFIKLDSQRLMILR